MSIKLYVTEEDGSVVEAAEIKLEDLSQYYNESAERWLYVNLVH